MKKYLCLSVLILLLTGPAALAAEYGLRGSITVQKHTSLWELANLAQLSAGDAIDRALAKEPNGVVTEVELEVEDGALVFEVAVVRADHTKVELIIDAGDGRILEIEADD